MVMYEVVIIADSENGHR